jgi:hypothetical protein
MSVAVPAWAEPIIIRGRTLVKTAIGVTALLAVFLGAYNLLGATALELPAVRFYPKIGAVYAMSGGGAYLGDIFVTAIGAVVAWTV